MRNQANLGFEEKLFKAADKLRKNMDAAEYKHVVLGLIFLKYVSDAFQHRRSQLEAELRAPESGFDDDAIQRTLEDRDEYAGEGVFWVPVASRWDTLQATATQPMIGQRIDDALYQLEQENPSLKAVFNRNYARPSLEDRTLTELINLFSDIDFMAGRHDENESEQDVVGRVYEYCLKSFASLEGKRGGQFYTPPVVVRILVEMLEPYEGRVFDPCCGSGGMFVQSKKFIREHTRQQPGMFNPKGISVYGQESNETTWRLCQMNLAVHGIDGDIKWNPEGSFLRDAHPDLRADFVIANPPFNDSDWSGHLLRDDARWKLGVPPPGNANYAWIQHFLYHLNEEGFAGFVMASGGDADEAANRKEKAIKAFFEKLDTCRGLLHGFTYDDWMTGTPQDRLELLADGVDLVLGFDDEKQKRFAARVYELGQAYALSVPDESVMEHKLEVAFFQAIRAAYQKEINVPKPGQGRTNAERELAVKQLVSKAILPGGVIDLFRAAGLEKPNIALLSDEFLNDLKNLPRRNLALELLKRLLNEEIALKSEKNVVKARTFAEMLEEAVKRYTNQAIEMAQLIEELVQMAKEFRDQRNQGEKLGLNEDEEAFYDALATNNNAVEVMGDEKLALIARELLSTVRQNATIDWHVRESVRANLRRLIKRILRKYGYPPDLENAAVQFVIEQAEVICRGI